MKEHSLSVWMLLLFSCLVLGQNEVPSEIVPTILEIEYSIEKKETPSLIVNVIGEVPTAGWENPTLVPRTYIQPPEDGIWEYDFFAVRPDMAAQVISTISASHKWENYPLSIKGIRVYGIDEGVKEKLFADQNEEK